MWCKPFITSCGGHLDAWHVDINGDNRGRTWKTSKDRVAAPHDNSISYIHKKKRHKQDQNCQLSDCSVLHKSMSYCTHIFIVTKVKKRKRERERKKDDGTF